MPIRTPRHPLASPRLGSYVMVWGSCRISDAARSPDRGRLPERLHGPSVISGVQDMHPDTVRRELTFNPIGRRTIEVLLALHVEHIGDGPEVDARLLGVGGNPQFADGRLVAHEVGEGTANLNCPGAAGGSVRLAIR